MKKMRMFLLTAMIAAAVSVPVQAGEWRSDAKGWWYAEDDGSYPVSQWKEVNGKYYYFGADGYMLADTVTPDGYQVGADGAWIQGVQAGAQDDRYLDAYASFLRSYKIPKGTTPKFHLLYIDGDAIPELAICEGASWHGAPVDLYGYASGNVQKISSFGQFGSISYVQRASLFCDEYAGAGGWHQFFYTLQNNTCIPLIRFAYGESETGQYVIDSTPVTEAVYDSQLAAWNARYAPVRFAGYEHGHTINETNIKKMLENIQNVMAINDK